MPLDNKLFDDLTRVAGGAASVLAALGKQVGEGLKDQMGDKFPSSSFSGFSGAVANDDVDRLQGVVTKLRLEQEDMKARIAELESLLGVAAKKVPASKKAAAPKAPAKKSAQKPAKKVVAKKSAPKKPAKKRA